MPLASQAATVIDAPDEDKEPDASVILMLLRELISLDAYVVVPLVYTAGMFMVPSKLLLTFVMIYFDEFTVNSYAMGVPEKRAARLVPVMLVVLRLDSVRGVAVVNSGSAFPLAPQALMVMDAGVDSAPDTSLSLMVLREPMELATKLVVPLV